MTRRWMVLAAATLVLAAAPAVAQPGRNLELKAHFNDFPPASGIGYASCWMYLHGDGREYAIIGTTRGTAIYNVTNINACYLVDSIPGPPSLWREMKSYRNWIYVVTEANSSGPGFSPGVQIIRMTDPENPVLAATYTGMFNRSHTISVDTTRALLYCNGTNLNNGTPKGVRILSIANPEAPVEIGSWGAGSVSTYVHDCVPIGNRLYASSIYVASGGAQRILDVTNPAVPTQISSWVYPGAYYIHNSWPSQDGSHIYVTDEQNGQTLRVFNISTPSAPVLVNEWTSNPQAIVHNAHVLGNELYLANYTEGIRVLDIADPAHPAEFAWSDTYAGSSGGFNGVWGVCPYFPSGTVISSDMNTGLYVYRLNRNYGRIRVEVHSPGSGPSLVCGVGTACCCAAIGNCSCTHHSTMAALDQASVYLTTQGDSATTHTDGIVQFAPDPGTHTVLVKKFGYEDVTAIVNVSPGSIDTVIVTLVPKLTASLAGTVRDASSQALLSEAQVSLAYTPVHQHTDIAGSYALVDVPEDLYRVQVQRPGYAPVEYERRIGPGFDGTQDYFLRATSYWNSLGSNAGWTVGSTTDNAIGGIWTWGEPLGTGVSAPLAPPSRAARQQALASRNDPWRDADVTAAGKPFERVIQPFHDGHEAEGATSGPVQPDKDRSPNPDSTCFFTGQGTNPTLIDEADVDGTGPTSLTSPALNATGMTEPTVGVWLWFYSQFRDHDDWLAVLISGNNGTSWVPVDTLRGIRNHWEHHAIPVADHVTPGTQVRVRFVAMDGGSVSVVEAAVDDLTLYDAALPSVGIDDGALHALRFRQTWPNPSSGNVSLVLDLPAAGPAEVEILDLAGRRVRGLHHGTAGAGMLSLQWNGLDDSGRLAPAGLYFARAATPSGVAQARIVRVQ